MSSILKALKKLDEQKSEKKEGAVNIARDILRTSRNAKKAENWILPTAVIALLLTGAMVAYFLVGGFSPDSKTESVLPVAEVEKEARPAEAADSSPVAGVEDQNAPTAGEDVVAEAETSVPLSGAGAPAGSVPEKSAPVVVDRPEAVFAGNPQPEPSSAGKQEARNPGVDESVAATQNADASAARIAADEETVRHQKETAATLKETAQVLKATAESLREKAEQARQAAVAARAAEQSVASGAESRAAASVTTVRLSSATADSEGAEPPTRHVYRPSDSTVAGGSANADLSKGEADQEESLPRVLTSNTESGKSRWTTATAAGAFPELNVSEIHYQYEVENRLAVVNDLPVMEGTVIDGARVDRILKDRVRFIFNGQYKEIRVSR